MLTNNVLTPPAELSEIAARRTAELIRLCDRVTEAAAVIRRGAVVGNIRHDLIPRDVQRRLDEYLCDRPEITAEGLVCRALVFWFRNVLNCEPIPQELARVILAGRPVECDRGTRFDGPTGDYAAIDDETWQRCEAVLPPLPPARTKPRTADLRAIVDTINYRWQTGTPWRRLPPNLPPWPTAYFYFRRWFKDGTLRKLRGILNPPTRAEIAAKRGPKEKPLPR